MSHANDSLALSAIEQTVRETIHNAAQRQEGEVDLKQLLSLMMAFQAGRPDLSPEQKNALRSTALEHMKLKHVSYSAEILYREKYAPELVLFGKAFFEAGKLNDALKCLQYVTARTELLTLAQQLASQKEWFLAGQAVALAGDQELYSTFGEETEALELLSQGAMLGRLQLWLEPPLPEVVILDEHRTVIAPYLPQ